MARFSGLDRGVDALFVAHFADENDVWILTHGVANAVGERVGVDPNFALLELRLFIFKNKFDWVLDADNANGALKINALQQGAGGRAFALTSRAGHDYQSAQFVNDRAQSFRQVQFRQRLCFLRHETKRKGLRAFLFAEVRAITIRAVIKTQVVFAPTPDRIDSIGGKILRKRSVKLLLRHRRKFVRVEANEFSIDANGVRPVGLDVKIGSLLRLAPGENLSQ